MWETLPLLWVKNIRSHPIQKAREYLQHTGQIDCLQQVHINTGYSSTRKGTGYSMPGIASRLMRGDHNTGSIAMAPTNTKRAPRDYFFLFGWPTALTTSPHP